MEVDVNSDDDTDTQIGVEESSQTQLRRATKWAVDVQRLCGLVFVTGDLRLSTWEHAGSQDGVAPAAWRERYQALLSLLPLVTQPQSMQKLRGEQQLKTPGLPVLPQTPRLQTRTTASCAERAAGTTRPC